VNDERKTKKELIEELDGLRRERAVEAALERVRSEALAMQTTQDLPSVSVAVFREIQDLDIKAINTIIGVIDEERDQASQWIILPEDLPEDAGPIAQDKVYDGSIRVAEELFALSKFRQINSFWKEALSDFSQDAFPIHLSKHSTKAESLEEVDHLVELGLWTPEQAEGFRSWVSIDLDLSFFRHKQSYLFLHMHEPLSPREIEELKRFVEVFSFAYDRFHDLQDRERRTREALVEAALERVRSEALAMQTTQDLPSVSAAVFRELQALNFASLLTAIGVADQDRDLISQWAVLPADFPKDVGHFAHAQIYDGGIRISKEYFPISKFGQAHPFYEGCMSTFTQDGPPVYLSSHWTKSELIEVSERFVELGLWTPDEAKGSQPTWLDDTYHCFFQHKQSYLWLFRQVPLSPREVGELKRLVEVFAFAHDRYLDVQRLEQQADQARRERAVERVRAEAMAMRSSDDLLKVVGVMYQEMNKLGIDTPSTSIILIDEDRDQRIHYAARENPVKFGLSWSSPSWVEYDKNTVVGIRGRSSLKDLEGTFKSQFDCWKNREVSIHGLMTDKLKIADILRNSDLPVEEVYLDSFMARSEGKQIVSVPFDYGVIGFYQKGRKEEQETRVQELSEAFSLGYLRFLDFQKVDEAQKNLIEELEEELQTAHDLQMGLMPTESPQVEGFDITGRCIPANHVGGDFFQYFQQDGKLSVCMADVTGHAMEAAVPVMMFSGVLKSQMELGEPIETLFGRLNRTMNSSLDKRTYVCFTMIELDLAQRRLQLANSGCPYPFHYHSSTGEVTELQVDAYPLGVRAETTYTAIETSLETGDYIVFCSDGIIEAANTDEGIFGFEQTAETIRAGCGDSLSAEVLIDRLVGAVQAFAGDKPQGDDMTCVVLRVQQGS